MIMKRPLALFTTVMLVLSIAFPACAAKKTLQIAAGFDDTYSTALSQFTQDTGISIRSESCQDVVKRIMSRDKAFAVYRLTSDTNTLTNLLNKGYGVGLSDDKAVQAFTASLIPAVAETVTYDGQIVAVPTDITFPYVFSVNRTLWADCGLTDDDIPATMTELFDFIDQWQDRYADQYPDVTPFYPFGVGGNSDDENNPYFGLVMEMYRDSIIQTTGTLTYDTPVFRDLLARIAPYAEPENKAADFIHEVPQMQKTLIYCTAVKMGGMFLRTAHEVIAPLAVIAGSEPFQPFYVQCAFVNPYSPQTDDAKKLLSYYVLHPNEEVRCELILNASPAENASFEADYQSWVEMLKTAQTMLTSDSLSDGERADYERKKVLAQRMVDNPDEYRYQIPPDKVTSYQQVLVPILWARGTTIYDTDALTKQLNSIIKQYVDGALTMDQFVAQMDHTIDMIVLQDGK